MCYRFPNSTSKYGGGSYRVESWHHEGVGNSQLSQKFIPQETWDNWGQFSKGYVGKRARWLGRSDLVTFWGTGCGQTGLGHLFLRDEETCLVAKNVDKGGSDHCVFIARHKS